MFVIKALWHNNRGAQMKWTHGLAALALSLTALAARAEITGTVTAVSDYDFRGITQSAQDPALQGSIDYAHESGFYAGVWGSNVDFGDDAEVEVDYYGGYSGGEDITYDVGVIWYSYPDTDAQYDFGEVYGEVGYKWLSGKIWYSPDFSSTGDSAFYYEANGAFELPANFGLSAHVGYSDGDYWDSAFDGGYMDWSVGVTYTLGHFDLGLKWIDGSDLEEADGTPDDVFSSEARAVFSVSTTFPWGEEE
jgi:uncharacterized protein (TIGR02001 family)